jgi:hypothetical protein
MANQSPIKPHPPLSLVENRYRLRKWLHESCLLGIHHFAKSYASVFSVSTSPTLESTMQSAHAVVFGDPIKPVKLDDFRNVLIRWVPLELVDGGSSKD